MEQSKSFLGPKNLLKSVSYFSNLDPAQLEFLARAAIPRSFSANQVVFIEGEPCPGLYIVESGWLKAIKMGLDGREQVLQTLGPGEIFNAISVFTGALNQATVMALEDAKVWVIPHDVMLRLLEKDPLLAQEVIVDLAGRVQHLISLVEDLSLRTVESRLARLLLEQSVDGVVERRRWATQTEMASRLGTVTDVLNRTLRKMTEEGAISVSRDQIRILDQEELKSIAQIID